METKTKEKTNGLARTTIITKQAIALDTAEIIVPIKGVTPLICHNFSQKSINQIKERQAKKATKGREKRNPQADYEASKYLLPNGKCGFPAVAFKCAMVRAAKGFGMPMTDARMAFFIEGEPETQLVPINGKPEMREDMVRLQGSVADIRYRACFNDWSAELLITYNARIISAEQVVNLVNGAGFGVGVGEWRPERNGQHGRFEVVMSD